MEPIKEIEWWAYIHVNGQLKVKRYFDQEDLNEATASPFVAKVFAPAFLKTRQDAVDYFSKKYENT